MEDRFWPDYRLKSLICVTLANKVLSAAKEEAL
jgi:hypothetical protein